MAISVSTQKKAWKVAKQFVIYAAVGTCVIGGLNIISTVVKRASK